MRSAIPAATPRPAAVLERVHDRAARCRPASSRPSARRARTAAAGRTSGTARRAVCGCPHAVAARMRQARARAPSSAPHTSAVSPASIASLAHGAAARQQQVRRTTARACARARARVASAARAQRIGRHRHGVPHHRARRGLAPNHRSNASAPCSMSIGSPSLARWPHARAARTHGVSPRPVHEIDHRGVVRQRLDRHREARRPRSPDGARVHDEHRALHRVLRGRAPCA